VLPLQCLNMAPQYYILEILFDQANYDLVTSVLFDAEIFTFQEDAVSADGCELPAKISTLSKIICYFETRSGLDDLVAILEDRIGSICTLTVTSAHDDYLNSWKKYAKPVRISDAVIIQPSWIPVGEEAECCDAEIRIQLDPGYAFGSGSHETTILCARFLEDISITSSPSSMLDVGCGSGILSILGSKLGIPVVMGIDIDSYAVEASRENAHRNFSEGIRFSDMPLSEVTGAFDLVVANILSGTIVELFNDLKRLTSDCGFLVLSGVLTSEFDMFRDLIPVGQVQTSTLGEWCAIKVPASSFHNEQ
jgi:ribosomal protein L11 methyltransferase